MLVDLRPLLAQLDPATAQLTPAVDFIWLYKRELTSFFANTGAATQAMDPGSPLHYLRTTNPFNPENLAVYPKRLPTNRPNPYRLPGGFDDLPQGLPVYEDRQCNADEPDPVGHERAVPIPSRWRSPTAVPTIVAGMPIPPVTLPPIPQVPLTPEQAEALIPDELLQQIQEFAFGGQSSGGGAGAAVPQAGPVRVRRRADAVSARQRPRQQLTSISQWCV